MVIMAYNMIQTIRRAEPVDARIPAVPAAAH